MFNKLRSKVLILAFKAIPRRIKRITKDQEVLQLPMSTYTKAAQKGAQPRKSELPGAKQLDPWRVN